MTARTWPAAALGAAFAIPFLVLNALVVQQVPAVLAWLRPTGSTTTAELLLLVVLVLLLPVGAAVALSPLVRQRARGLAIVPNVLVGTVLLAGAALLIGTLGPEIVACEIQRVPNCD